MFLGFFSGFCDLSVLPGITFLYTVCDRGFIMEQPTKGNNVHEECYNKVGNTIFQELSVYNDPEKVPFF